MEYRDYTRARNIEVSNAEVSLSAINELIRELDLWYLGDALLTMKSRLSQWPNITSPVEQYYLLQFHPLLCGILTFHVILYLHELGNSFANERFMLGMAHFYNLVRQQEDCPIRAWVDMDLMIEFQSKRYILFGETPRTTDECYGKTCLAAGYSAAALFSNNRRKGAPLASTRERRKLKASPLVKIFREPYIGGRVLGSTTYDIEKLPKSQIEHDREDRPKKTKRQARTDRLSPLEFLKSFQHALTVEFPHLLFNYVRLHMHSLELLRDLRQRLHTDLQALVGDSYNEEMKKKVSSMCFHIVSITADFRRFTGVTPMQWKEGRVTVIRESRKALEDIIEKVGGVVSEELVEALKGENADRPMEAGLLFLERYGSVLATNENKVPRD